MPEEKTLTELRETVGIDACRQLQHLYGGQRLYFPVRLSPSHALVRALGQDVASKLCFAFGGNAMHIPFDVVESRRQRNLAIFADHRSKGLTVNELVRKYGISYRQIQLVLAKMRRELLTETPPETGCSTPQD